MYLKEHKHITVKVLLKTSYIMTFVIIMILTSCGRSVILDTSNIAETIFAGSDSEIKQTETTQAQTTKDETAKVEITKVETTQAETEKVESIKDDNGRAETIQTETTQAQITQTETDHVVTTVASGSDNVNTEPVSFSWASDATVINITNTLCRGPRVIKLSDGSMLCAYNGATIARSTNEGLSWSVIATAAVYPKLGLANPNLYEDNNGDVYLCFRANAQMTDYYYSSLHCCVSRDRGYTWEELPLICEYKERGVWEPHLGRLNGVLTVFYANDCLSAVKEPYQNIEYLQYNGEKWVNRTVVLNGATLKSRPGMPVWRRLSDGTYFCVIEGWIPGTNTLHLQYIYSEDGIKWSQPVSIYKAKTGALAGNPTFYELPSGQIIISYQTNEDAANPKGSEDRTTKTIISNGTDPKKLTAADFSTPDEVYATKEGGYQTFWGSVYYSGKYIYVSMQTNYPTVHGVLARYTISK